MTLDRINRSKRNEKIKKKNEKNLKLFSVQHCEGYEATKLPSMKKTVGYFHKF